jgi:WD40 repeat protein
MTLWNVGFGDSPEESGYAFRLACLFGDQHFMSAERVFTRAAPHQHDRIAIRSRADGRLLHSSPNTHFSSAVRVIGSPWSDAIVLLDRKRFRVYRSDDLTAPSRVIRNDKRREFTDFAFHPSGRYLAATSNDATVKLYDTTTWEVARTFTWDIGRMRSIAFSPDGTLAAAGSDTGKVVVWDVDL